jgi:hypothetical protein
MHLWERMMSNTYDCTEDVNLHIRLVRRYLNKVTLELAIERIQNHDASKLQFPEKAMYDEFTPRLKEVEFGSLEYKKALLDMGQALQHHYQHNRHHPEHFDNGVNGMTLIDLIEMVCDWNAAAFANGKTVDLEYQAKRFGISAQLAEIIYNTLRELNE